MDRISPDRLRELVDAHSAALTLYARQWCWSPEDALQEALIELLRQCPAPDHPLAWLFKTVRRRAQNLARGEFCRMHHHRRAAEQRETWFVSSGEAEFENAELAEMLEHLPPLEREIVVARVWGGDGGRIFPLPRRGLNKPAQGTASRQRRRATPWVTRPPDGRKP